MKLFFSVEQGCYFILVTDICLPNEQTRGNKETSEGKTLFRRLVHLSTTPGKDEYIIRTLKWSSYTHKPANLESADWKCQMCCLTRTQGTYLSSLLLGRHICGAPSRNNAWRDIAATHPPTLERWGSHPRYYVRPSNNTKDSQLLRIFSPTRFSPQNLMQSKHLKGHSRPRVRQVFVLEEKDN